MTKSNHHSLLSPLILFLSLFLAAPVFVQASPAIIKGKANDASGYIVRIIKFRDMVTKLDTTLAVDTIANDGSFVLECDVDDITYAFIDVEFQRAEIYLLPGTATEININFDPSLRNSLYFDRQPLEYLLIDPDISDENLIIREINRIYNDFILDNFNAIYRSRKKYLVDTLRVRLENVSLSDNKYIKDYITYKLASHELAARMKNKRAMAEEYLLGKEILYDNIEYIYFFEQFFDKYLMSSTGTVNQSVILTMFDENKNVSDFLSLLIQDPFLADERLSEFFLLGNLKSLYGHPDIPGKQIKELIRQLGKETRYREHKIISENLLLRLNRLMPGTSAPHFELPTDNKSAVTLEDFRGKPLYLGFFLSDNPTCRIELETLSGVVNEFGDRFNVLCISADKQKKDLEDYLKNFDFPWNTVHYNNDISLLEQYDATTYPLFILLDENGRIISYPAPRPSEGLSGYMNRVLK